MAARITASQRKVLEVLRALQGKVTDPLCRSYGFNPGDFGGPRAAAIARRLEPKGYVIVDRLSDCHLRYRISVSGWQLLAFIEEGRPWLVSRAGASK